MMYCCKDCQTEHWRDGHMIDCINECILILHLCKVTIAIPYNSSDITSVFFYA